LRLARRAAGTVTSGDMAYKNKTAPTVVSPAEFLDSVENERRREDGREVLKMMQAATGEKPIMWGPSIIGFGRHEYTTEAGHSGEILDIGFSPRKANLVFYIGSALKDEKLMSRLGKHRLSKGGCMYINKLDDIDRSVLKRLIEKSAASAKQRKKKR
jgi:hypothetical protein